MKNIKVNKPVLSIDNYNSNKSLKSDTNHVMRLESQLNAFSTLLFRMLDKVKLGILTINEISTDVPVNELIEEVYRIECWLGRSGMSILRKTIERVKSNALNHIQLEHLRELVKNQEKIALTLMSSDINNDNLETLLKYVYEALVYIEFDFQLSGFFIGEQIETRLPIDNKEYKMHILYDVNKPRIKIA
ncbi:hypothetical protein F9B85_11385 [Heliorestis acidaminivorans]|uniref:Uncharacterized protein n=1 Tax=Heliorestis acidaminivorans TaxID=553427 RepID=A0A6I0F392_9FIRM|nr:hypothetical protein [Heliorestis acidaminivorans]KAB2951630.1 hypothetical protein F9B85_11385 [Heliorestis acidaminivorans]